MDQKQRQSPREQGCPGASVRQQQVPLQSGSTRGSPGKASRWTPLPVSPGEGVGGAARRTLRLQGPFTTSYILRSRRNPPGVRRRNREPGRRLTPFPTRQEGEAWGAGRRRGGGKGGREEQGRGEGGPEREAGRRGARGEGLNLQRSSPRKGVNEERREGTAAGPWEPRVREQAPPLRRLPETKAWRPAEEVGGRGGAGEGEGGGEGIARPLPRQGAPNRPRPCAPTPYTSIQLRL